MNSEEFEKIVAEEFPNAIPEKFEKLLRNVAFLVEDEPGEEVRLQENLSKDETLLGYYHGIPRASRGSYYGVGPTLPDTIVLFQLPIEEEAEFLCEENHTTLQENIRQVVRETLWHQVAHYLGMDEHAVREKEDERDQKK